MSPLTLMVSTIMIYTLGLRGSALATRTWRHLGSSCEIERGALARLPPARAIPSENDRQRLSSVYCEIGINWAKSIARFMDDVYLFDDNVNSLQADFAEVQRLLGLKGLSVNGAKTEQGGIPKTDEANDHITELKKRLLKRRRDMIVSHYDFDFNTDEDEDNQGNSTAPLAEEEIEFILSLLNAGKLSEEDAELILVVMRNNVDRIEEHLGLFAKGFPHLAKNFYSLCVDAEDKEAVAKLVLDVINEGDHVGEYQLFWFGTMLENYLIKTKAASDIIDALYRHKGATDISKAKVLKIENLQFGLQEMREVFLREGRSDWLAWASAVGSRGMRKSARNYLLNYFKNGSKMNQLIAEIIQKD